MRRVEALSLALFLAGCAAATPASVVGTSSDAPPPREAMESSREEPLPPEKVPAESTPPPAVASAAPAAEEPPPPVPPTEPAKPPAEKPAPPKATKAQKPSLSHDPLLEELLSGGGPALKTVMAAPEKHRFQVLYGIVRDKPKASIERHGFRTDAEYYYPASSMKVPIALASFERMTALRKSGKPMTRDATIRMFPLSGSEPFATTLARETARALIVSDNVSANRLLSFVGHREAHESLWSLGLKSTRIHAGFATGEPMDPAKSSPKIEILGDAGKFEIPARQSTLELPPTDATGLSIGERTVVDGRIVPEPMSFAKKNAIRLLDLQNTFVEILRPELLANARARALTVSKDDLSYLRETLGTLPSQSGIAGYARNVVADYQLIPILKGIERVLPRGSFEIYSKVGQAYGFLIANAYVVEKATSRAFFVTAAVYANPDETMNNDKYAYDSISYPALADVGEVISRHAFAP